MKVKEKKLRFFIIIMPVILPVILMLFCYFRISWRENTRHEVNGENENSIIVLFNKDIDKKDLYSILKDYKASVEIREQMGNYALLCVKDSRKYKNIMGILDNNPLVKAVQPDGIIESMYITDDIYAKTQWAIDNPGYYSVFASGVPREVSAVPDIDMDVDEDWLYMAKENVKRRQVIVAVIDTGIDYMHPDLAENIWVNENEIPGDGIDNDNNGYIDDIYGWDFYNDDASVCHYQYDKKTGSYLSLPEDNDDHGTHIAGIIGAVRDNKIGIAGIASNIDIKIMILKINGGRRGTGSISDAVLAVKYATMMGADICNISWGTSQYSPALKEAMRESDMLFVAAAGNQGTNNDDNPVYPASFDLDNLISVTFIDANGNLTKKSNYGTNSVDIAAPGDDILSTVVGSYETLSGSSMAAPQVSAVAALLYSYNENLYPSEIKDLIINTLKPVDGLKNLIKYPGIPDAYKAVLKAGETETDMSSPDIKLSTGYNKEKLTVTVKAEDEGSGIRVIRWLPGEKEIEDFRHGTAGYDAENGRVSIKKAGTYTFYAGDYAGNESIKVYKVRDDTTPPSVFVSYIVSEDNITTVTVRAKDSQSGIKLVKYMEGKRKADDFMPAGAGTELRLKNNKATFKVKKSGYYTIYAIDYRGNQTVKIIRVKTVSDRR